ncbi:MAG: ATP-binding protein [Acidobacteriota bacterium]
MYTLTIRSELAELGKIRDFLKKRLTAFRLSEEDSFRIELSLVEMCTNIMRYAYPRDSGEISVRAWHEKGRFYLEIRDNGIPFDPRRVKRPSLKEMINRDQMGGLGIFLARKLMDGFAYRREDNQNILTMFKRVKAREA